MWAKPIRLRDPKWKPRPWLVVSDTAQNATTGKFYALAISTQYVESAPGPNELPLVYNASGKSITKLRKPCAVVCDWMDEFDVSDIESVGGNVPDRDLKAALARHEAATAAPTPDSAAGGTAAGDESPLPPDPPAR